MAFQFLLDLANTTPVARPEPEDFLVVAGRRVPIVLARNSRARRYVLRMRPDGSARVTVPRGGSLAEARRFAVGNTAWLAEALERLTKNPVRPKEWRMGTEIFFRGELVKIQPGINDENGLVRFGTEVLKVPDHANLRRAVERHLWKLAVGELPSRVLELAALHQLLVQRVTVRNQRSRWGSCSRRGTISLNWRLIQAPASVRDYIILHELMHLRHMNHSARFWREVKKVCSDYELAERWLKGHSLLQG